MPTAGFLEGLPPEPFILFVGAFRAYKGLGTLLAAYERLAAPPPLVLIGSVVGTASAETFQAFPPGVKVFTTYLIRMSWRRGSGACSAWSLAVA